MAEPRRASARCEQRLPGSPQLHKLLLHEGQRTRHLSDRVAIGGGADADGHRLTGERSRILDDEFVRQGGATERFSDATKRGLVGNRERDDDRRRVTRGFRRRVGCLGDLRTVWEVSPD